MTDPKSNPAREAFKAAMVTAAAHQGGAGAQFIANGHSNLWLDIAYAAAEAIASPAPSVSGEVERIARIIEPDVAWDASNPLHGVSDFVARREAAREKARQIAAPAPSCAPGEVGALAWISGYAADFARNPDQPTNTIRNAFTAIERKAAAALSPQGLDAKEGEKAYRCKGCGWKGDDPIAIGHPQNGCDLELMVPVERKSATPSQRLDAATVECTASHCEGYGPWKVLALHRDSAWIVHYDERGMATYRSVDQADLIATEAHQHGAGNE